MDSGKNEYLDIVLALGPRPPSILMVRLGDTAFQRLKLTTHYSNPGCTGQRLLRSFQTPDTVFEAENEILNFFPRVIADFHLIPVCDNGRISPGQPAQHNDQACKLKFRLKELISCFCYVYRAKAAGERKQEVSYLNLNFILQADY